jgi:Reverse transcriptase (RNA-dependent DNA polymerase)
MHFLHEKLQLVGFKRSHADQCLYTRMSTHGKTYLTVYVDDMMLAFPNVVVSNWFETAIKGRNQIVIQDDNMTYLGMSVTKTEHGIKVHQSGYIDTLKIGSSRSYLSVQFFYRFNIFARK